MAMNNNIVINIRMTELHLDIHILNNNNIIII